jgi:microcystin-dependent protein
VTEPFIGEIRMLSFNFAPTGWAVCNGQSLPINQNQALFSLLGSTYGGDGMTTFWLPDLRTRMPMHRNGNYPIGQHGGEVSHILTTDELPAHTHRASASSSIATTVSPTGAVWANTGKQSYSPAPNGAMDPGTVTATGLSQAHQNMPPFLAITFVIALQGIFPPRDLG